MSSINKIVEDLWRELGRARAEAMEFDIDPWESENCDVKTIWKQIIHPDNLAALEQLSRSDSELNPTALEAARKARDACRKHMSNDGLNLDSLY